MRTSPGTAESGLYCVGPNCAGAAIPMAPTVDDLVALAGEPLGLGDIDHGGDLFAAALGRRTPWDRTPSAAAPWPRRSCSPSVSPTLTITSPERIPASAAGPGPVHSATWSLLICAATQPVSPTTAVVGGCRLGRPQTIAMP